MGRPATCAPFIVIRLWPEHHKNLDLLKELLSAFKRQRGCCDEVWFCTEIGSPNLEAHRESARQMQIAAKLVREAGILPGLQVANTLGHGDSAQRPSEGIAWRTMVGHDGRTSKMCHCPRDPRLHAYLGQMMRAYAAFQPSSVWIDDDLRMANHFPLRAVCYCDGCLAEFSRLTEREWTRGNLVQSLASAEDQDLRQSWGRFNQESLAMTGGAIAEAVHAVAPACRMGLQHAIGGPYVGGDLKGIFDTMSRATGHPAGSRPGGGYYIDHAPRQVIDKAYEVAQQIAQLPDEVDRICPEIEDYPHLSMGKTPHGVVIESTLDLAIGCNSLSYAILCSALETPDFYETILERIAKWRPFWERMMRVNETSVPAGVRPAYDLHSAREPFAFDDPNFAFRGTILTPLFRLTTMGLPVCIGSSGATASLLHANAIPSLSDEQIREVLRGGVMMDGSALHCLQERGLGPLVGARAVWPAALDSCEKLTADPINGEFAGRTWKQFLTGEPRTHEVFQLEDLGAESRVLGQYINVRGQQRGVASAAFETELGGRVAIFGYQGWQPVVNAARRHQLLAAADWVSRGRLPVIVETPAQVMVVPRVDAEGRLRGVLLLNVTIDRSPPLRLRLRGTQEGKWAWAMPDSADVNLSAEVMENEIGVATPALAPWSAAALIPQGA